MSVFACLGAAAQAAVILPDAGSSLSFEAESYDSSVGVSTATDTGVTFVDGVGESGTGVADGDYFRYSVSNVDASTDYALYFLHRRNGGGGNVNQNATLEVFAAQETAPDVFTYTALGTMNAIWQSSGWSGGHYYEPLINPDTPNETTTVLADANSLSFNLPSGTTHLHFEFANEAGSTTARIDQFTIVAIPEPSAFALSGIALLGLLGRRSRA